MTFNWQALIASFVTIGSTALIATGHPATAAIVSDPNTASALQAIIGGASAIWLAFLPAIHKS